MTALPIYVISLARAAERRAGIAAHLARLGVGYEMVEAVDGHAMTEGERRSFLPSGEEQPPGVIGCYLSHMQVYRRLLEGSAPAALILEDDARLTRASLPLLRQGPLNLDFDYCFLDYVNRTDVGPIYYDAADAVEIAPRIRAYTTQAGPGGTAAYLITRGAAERRLAHALPIRHAVDIYTVLPYRPHFRVVIYPRCAGVSELGQRSLITTTRDDLGQLRLRWLRRWSGFYRLRDALWLEGYRLWPGVHALQRAGVLPPRRRWRPLPPGRPILLDP